MPYTDTPAAAASASLRAWACKARASPAHALLTCQGTVSTCAVFNSIELPCTGCALWEEGLNAAAGADSDPGADSSS